MLSTGWIVFISLIAIALGYLSATVRQSGKITRLQTELDQSKEDLKALENQYSENKSQIKKLEESCHEQTVELTTIRERLQASLANVERLSGELARKNEELQSTRLAAENLRNQRQESEMKLGSADTEIRALKEQLTETRDRLLSSIEALDREREHVNVLKEKLADEGKLAKALETSEKEARNALAAMKHDHQEQSSNLKDLQDRYNALSIQHTELKTSLENREEQFKEQLQQLNDMKAALTKEFENIANKIFEEKGKTFVQSSQTSIDSLLKPFRDQIESFQKRVNEVHDASVQSTTTLNAEIRRVMEIGLQMSKEATNLATALKGDSQQRGAWGEAQLRRTLEMSGLVEDTHYEAQPSLKDAEGKNRQPDYLIKLPDGKHIIIDSKVELNAYDRAISASSPEEYKLAIEDHVNAVRRHIDDLSSKDYTNLLGIRSPSFVLMFMPIEAAYIEALKSHKDLFDYGYRRNVVLVSHTTLIPILRTVSNLWMIERSNAEAREISEKAGDIFNQVCTVAERLSKLGGTLEVVSNHYNSVVKAMAGKQGLYGKVDRFSQLSAKVSKSLPKLDPVHTDFENERLALIVEPVPDDVTTTDTTQQLNSDPQLGDSTEVAESGLSE